MTHAEPVTLLVTLRARTGCGDRLREELGVLAASSRGDAGCIRYDVLEETEAPDRFVLVEEWLDDQCLVRHNALPHVSRFLASSLPLIAVPMKVQRLRRSG